MAPTSRRRSSEKPQQKPSTATRTRIITRSIFKKEQSVITQQRPKKSISKSKSNSISNQVDSPYLNQDDNFSSSSIINSSNDVCSTPKSEKYKIPEIMTCPPAPKKPKTNNCLFQKRRSISFFAHPDIDKFFVFAMRDSIKV
ncbi:Cyclin-dependent protein kinase inhibitor SMR9 [Bienertia sinuspersici]